MAKRKKSKLKYALAYAQKGWLVLPLWWSTEDGCACEKSDCKENNRGKHPRPSNGLHAATTDLEQIKNWWEVTPDGNIGIRTGKESFFIVDVDGPEGRESLTQLEEKYGALPETVTVETGRGLHYYFKHPETAIKCSSGEIGENIDIKGDGGYAIVPPSTHYSGHTYAFAKGKGIDDIEIADPPDWLLQMLNSPAQSAALVLLPKKNTNIHAGKKIPNGKRNDTLFRLACSLRSRGYDHDEIVSNLSEINQAKCTPPLDLVEVDIICNSVSKYPKGVKPEFLKRINAAFCHMEQWFNDNNGQTPIDFKEILEDPAFVDSLAVIAVYDQTKCELYFQETKAKGLKSRDEAQLRSLVTTKRKQLQNTIDYNETPGVPITEFIKNPPVPPETIVPAGYEIDLNGIRKIIYQNKNRSELETIATAPVLFKGRLINISDKSEFMDLLWYRDEDWRSETVPRVFVADSQKIVTLADKGFPVTSPTARDLVQFLNLLESYNINTIIKAELSKSLGWLGKNGDKGFLFGHKLIPPNGSGIALNANLKRVDNKAWKKGSIFFYSDDPGENSLAEGIVRKGAFGKWKNVLGIVNKNPIIAFMCYASVASIILEIFDLPNFIVDLSGPTTTGKTTAMKVAASIFGNPNTNSKNCFIKSWNSSQVFVERVAHKLGGLPLFLDDTKLIRDPDVISKIIYQAAFGQGRGRGNPWGVAAVLDWNSVMLSTGEIKILDLIKKGDGGAHGRVISVCTPPFAEQNSKNARHISKLNQIISNNYGIAGTKFIRFLLKNRESWPQWKLDLKNIKKIYDSKADKTVMYRLADYFASIHFAAQLFDTALDLNLDYVEHLNFIFNEVDAEVSRSANAPREALNVVINHCIAYQNDFYNHRINPGQPSHGWLGVWDKKQGPALIPTKLKQILEKQGFEPMSILKEWKRLGWLQTPKGRSLTLKRTVGAERVRCYVIKRSAMYLVTKNSDK